MYSEPSARVNGAIAKVCGNVCFPPLVSTVCTHDQILNTKKKPARQDRGLLNVCIMPIFETRSNLLRQPQIGLFVDHDVPAISVNRIQNAQALVGSGQWIAAHAVVVDVQVKPTVTHPTP